MMSFIRNRRTTSDKSRFIKRYTPIMGTLLFGTLIGSLLSIASTSAIAATTGSAETFKFSVVPMAAKLPADGNSYPIMIQLQTAKDSHPIEASHDLTITLLSSDETVASPQSKVVLKMGQSLVSAALSTTSKAGAVEITAAAQGIKSDVAKIETLSFGSLDPTKLAVYAGASSFIPDPAYPGKMYVQLLNAGGIPAATNKTLTVYLSSGDVRVGTVPKFVTIQKGATGTSFDFTPTNQVGKTTVTASANGLAPAQMSLKTSGPISNKLVIEFAPPSMPAPFGYNSMFTVQLRDSDDNPVLAKQPITVNLSSSDTNIGKAPLYLTIEQGHSYASGKIESNGSIGTATITASSQGLIPGSSSISTFDYNQASDNAQKEISVYTVPSQIVANNDEKAIVVVQVTDTSGNVYTSKSYLYYSILVSSSDPDLGSVDNNLVSDITYATTTFKSSFQQGESTISASASGYAPGSADMTISGSVPTSLQITQIPGILVADNSNIGSAIIGLFDDKGRPTLASRDVLVSLSSSNPEIVSVEPTEFIPAGKSYGQIQVHPTTKAGKATITAQAQGLAPSSVDFKTVGNTGDSSQYKLGISAVPKLPADGRTYDSVFIQLQDSNENPVLATSDTQVVLSSSSMLAGAVDEEITIKKGSSFSMAKFTTTLTAASFKITASSIGFGTVETDQQETTLQPLTIALPSTLPSRGQFGDNIPVALDVFTVGTIPVNNATVQVGGRAANVTTTTTDINGHAESSYVATQPGMNSITLTVMKPGYETKAANYGILLDQTVSIKVDARTMGGKPVQLQAKISGPGGSKTLDLDSGASAHADNMNWGSYKISVPEEFSTVDSQYKFIEWSDGVKESIRTANIINDSNFTAIYSVKYLVTVSSAHGTTDGGGYYSEGAKALITVNPTSTGTFLVQSVFNGWTGDIKSGTATTEIMVDSPKTINAEWSDNYFVVFALVGAAGAGGFVAYYKIIKPRREAKAKERAPDLDWYKS